jgi:FKBP-type peptidyl-prolyl cis-trans isomerase SlpA
MRKLNETDCVNISKDYLLGMSYQKLSEKYNICTWSIRNALKKQNIKSRIRKYNCDENYFEKIDTFEKAYWLGLLFADGYVRKRKQFNGKHKQGGIVGISLKNGDEYLLNKFINDLKSNYSLTKQIKDDFLSSKLEINSSKMVDDLIKLGCVPKKSLILLPPKINYDFIKQKKMSKVTESSSVVVNYTGKLTDGSVFDSSLLEGREPLNAKLGEGQLIPGFETGLIGMMVGDKKTIEIDPREAYGERNKELILDVVKTNVPENVEIGMLLQTFGPEGPALVKVLEIKDESVVIDANHPLAGEKLIFELEVMGIS